MAEAISQLRIYTNARSLEDRIYDLIKTLPADQFYGLANDLHRSSSGVAHHICSAHKLFSYRLKLEELSATRRESEVTMKLLRACVPYFENDDIEELQNLYTDIIKQSWVLSKWLTNRMEEKSLTADLKEATT